MYGTPNIYDVSKTLGVLKIDELTKISVRLPSYIWKYGNS